jgi:hypothetical protein
MNWKMTVIWLVVVVVLAFAVHEMSTLNFWVALVLVIGAMLVNGYIAAIEDDWPGGFNNPDPPPGNTQRWVAQVTERMLLNLYRRRR